LVSTGVGRLANATTSTPKRRILFAVIIFERFWLYIPTKESRFNRLLKKGDRHLTVGDSYGCVADPFGAGSLFYGLLRGFL
jgi:hypothetical protein